ncbi:MAG: carbon-nitrogen hydrolase family protein [Halobacteriales archaeon]|nr:carbon-nitrogen hydrolase family protein [Halobacteriales archaeon]
MRYKAAALQMQCGPDKAANLQKAMELLRAAVRDGAKLIVMPELFSTGYDPPAAAKEAESAKSGSVSFQLKEEANRKDLWIVGSIAERPELPQTKPTISSFLVAPEGVSESARKIHLWDQEKLHFAAGARTKVLNSRLGRIGPVNCYDLEFPEVARSCAVKGAQLLVSPAAFMTGDIWDLATRARALENGCWLIAANHVGPAPGGKRFCGHARIVAPDGRVLHDAGEKEGYAIADVDPIQVLDHRKARPYLTDLRKFE